MVFTIKWVDMVEKVELSVEEIVSTAAFQRASRVTQEIYKHPSNVKAVAGWLTVAKYKGIEHMMNSYHMDEFKRALVRELFELKLAPPLK